MLSGWKPAPKKGTSASPLYRDHGHMLACGHGCQWRDGRTYRAARGVFRAARAARCTCSRREKHFYGGHGIVGAQVPIGAGLALADKYKGNDNVTFTYFGDGAANQGQVYETYNMAELWDLPVIFVIENNGYAMGTSVKRSTKSTTLFGRGTAYGIAGEQVDGMDVLAVKAAGEKAVAHCRAGKGPYILEMMTYRYRGHSMSDPAKYRTREEVEKMKAEKDAIEHVRDLLLGAGLANEDELKAIDKGIKDVVNASAEFAKESPEPDVSELYTDIYA
ncbi:MAG: thiamine pyrophosphate-dependent enzyme [Cypionkella sp.]|nr:thiamine pyrophosphate-dependent enzyme [Cypionkella sp.]